MGWLKQSDLDRSFGPRSGNPDERARFGEIRAAGKFLAEVILRNTPPCGDQSAAVRKIREAVWAAHGAIASSPEQAPRDLPPLVIRPTGLGTEDGRFSFLCPKCTAANDRNFIDEPPTAVACRVCSSAYRTAWASPPAPALTIP
jgi:hypothetical protein